MTFQPASTAPYRRARPDDSPRRRSRPSPRSSQERHTHLPLFPPLLHIHILIRLTQSQWARSKAWVRALGMAIMDVDIPDRAPKRPWADMEGMLPLQGQGQAAPQSSGAAAGDKAIIRTKIAWWLKRIWRLFGRSGRLDFGCCCCIKLGRWRHGWREE